MAELRPVAEPDPWTLETVVSAVDHLAGKTTHMTPAEVLAAIRDVLGQWNAQDATPDTEATS